MSLVFHVPFSPLILETHLSEERFRQTLTELEAFLGDAEAVAAHPENSPVLRSLSRRAEIPTSVLYEDGLAECIQEMGNTYLKEALSRMDPEDLRGTGGTEDLETFLKVAWINEQFEGDFVPIHKHSSDLSGVIYLKIPEAMKGEGPQGRLAFFEGRPAAFVREKMVFLPKEGAVFIFPGWLNHMVYPFKGEGKRWVISFNLMVGRRG